MRQLKPLGSYTVKKCQVAGFTLTESLYPPKLEQAAHDHGPASFSILLEGDFTETFERKRDIYQPSTIVFHPPQKNHAVLFGLSNVRILNVEFDRLLLERVREHSAVLDTPAGWRTQSLGWLGNKIYREFSRMDAISGLAIEGMVFEILAEASRSNKNSSKPPRWLDEVKDFLHDNFTHSFNLETVARSFGVHPVHLARVFRRHCGGTIGEYVRRLRVEFAARQLRAGGAPVGEIACAAGFADQSHFTKTFKKLYGVTPAEYRRTSRRS